MKHSIAATALCALMLSSGLSLAQTGSDSASPVKPGGMRITTLAPEQDKWNVQRSPDGTLRVFKCKPLACSDPQTVSFRFSRSPTRHPDPKALEKFAQIDLPKSIRAAGAAREVLSDGAEKIETLASKTATLKGYPSVVNESKLSGSKTAAYIQTAIIFAGPIMIRVQSSSPNQELAKKALDEFVDAMRIEEGPALPKPGTPAESSAKKQSI